MVKFFKSLQFEKFYKILKIQYYYVKLKKYSLQYFEIVQLFNFFRNSLNFVVLNISEFFKIKKKKLKILELFDTLKKVNHKNLEIIETFDVFLFFEFV